MKQIFKKIVTHNVANRNSRNCTKDTESKMGHSKKIAQIEVHAKEEAIMINDGNLPQVI